MYHVIYILFLDLLQVRYGLSSIIAGNVWQTFGRGVILLPPIREQPKKCPSWIGLKKAVLKNFAKLTGKHLCWDHFFIKLHARKPFLKKDSSTGAFCKSCKNFTKFSFIEYIRVTFKRPFCSPQMKWSQIIIAKSWTHEFYHELPKNVIPKRLGVFHTPLFDFS